jgi:hypothetical protein
MPNTSLSIVSKKATVKKAEGDKPFDDFPRAKSYGAFGGFSSGGGARNFRTKMYAKTETPTRQKRGAIQKDGWDFWNKPKPIAPSLSTGPMEAAKAGQQIRINTQAQGLPWQKQYEIPGGIGAAGVLTGSAARRKTKSSTRAQNNLLLEQLLDNPSNTGVRSSDTEYLQQLLNKKPGRTAWGAKIPATVANSVAGVKNSGAGVKNSGAPIVNAVAGVKNSVAPIVNKIPLANTVRSWVDVPTAAKELYNIIPETAQDARNIRALWNATNVSLPNKLWNIPLKTAYAIGKPIVKTPLKLLQLASAAYTVPAAVYDYVQAGYRQNKPIGINPNAIQTTTYKQPKIADDVRYDASNSADVNLMSASDAPEWMLDDDPVLQNTPTFDEFKMLQPSRAYKNITFDSLTPEQQAQYMLTGKPIEYRKKPRVAHSLVDQIANFLPIDFIPAYSEPKDYLGYDSDAMKWIDTFVGRQGPDRAMSENPVTQVIGFSKYPSRDNVYANTQLYDELPDIKSLKKDEQEFINSLQQQAEQKGITLNPQELNSYLNNWKSMAGFDNPLRVVDLNRQGDLYDTNMQPFRLNTNNNVRVRSEFDPETSSFITKPTDFIPTTDQDWLVGSNVPQNQMYADFRDQEMPANPYEALGLTPTEEQKKGFELRNGFMPIINPLKPIWQGISNAFSPAGDYRNGNIAWEEYNDTPLTEVEDPYIKQGQILRRAALAGDQQMFENIIYGDNDTINSIYNNTNKYYDSQSYPKNFAVIDFNPVVQKRIKPVAKSAKPQQINKYQSAHATDSISKRITPVGKYERIPATDSISKRITPMAKYERTPGQTDANVVRHNKYFTKGGK